MINLNRFYKFIVAAIFVSCVVEMNADKNFRNHRFDSFRVLPENQSGDIVFIGNSITNMINWNELFGNLPNIKNRGTSGAYTQEIVDNLESMISGTPSKVFLMIGTNDLGTEGNNYTPDAVAYRTEKILAHIRKEVPEAEVYYQSILPSEAGNRNSEKITQTNKLVENWIKSQKDPKLTYIDLYTPFEENGALKNSSSTPSGDSYSFDGLHLTQKGYKIWADIIKDYVGVSPVIPIEASNFYGNLKGSNGMRTTYFGALPVKSSDILIIGDEMVHGGEWQELLGSPDFKDRGIGWGFPGVSIENVYSILSPIFDGNRETGVIKETPRAVILYLGNSDLRNDESIDITISKYENILSEIRSLKNDLPIFVMTLAPVGKFDEDLDSKICIFNEKLSKLTDNAHGIYMIDTHQTFSNEDGKRKEIFFTGPQSPYLSGLGYVIVANEIVGNVNNIFNTNYKAITYDQAVNNIKNFHKATDANNGSFLVFDNTNSEVPYRIPAIAKNKNGDLIAVADYRYSKADIGMSQNGKLDLRYRIKDAQSGEWGEVKTLAAAFGEEDDNIAFGDPCIVADKESDLVLVTSCSGNISFPKGTHQNHQGWARFYSYDGGKTWSDYEEIGKQVFNILDQRNDGPINAFFIGSGKIEQSDIIKTGDYYRIYCAALARVNDGKTKVNYVFYSDDFGKNWNLLGDVDDCPIPFGADEPKAEELPDGSVLISSRIRGGRYYNVFRYSDVEKGKGKWGEMAKSDSDVNGVIASDNACNGETLLVPVLRNSDGKSTYLLLQSVPMDENGRRAQVGINYKDLDSLPDKFTPADIARDWDGNYMVTENSSAYSTMTLDKDNNVAFLFEENVGNWGYDIIYREICIEDITGGKYRFAK